MSDLSRVAAEAEMLGRLVATQQEKLALGRSKRHWRDVPLSSLVVGLVGEGAELIDALRSGDDGDVLRESADVANYAGMIADAVRFRSTGEVKQTLEEVRGFCIDAIAAACHEVNRAYCESLGDRSQVAWDEAPEWQKDSARAGVELHLGGDHGPEASHESWMAQKVADGWVCGPVKNPAAKTHPCLVPFAELPREQQAKDYIFRAVVLAYRGIWGSANG